MNSDIDIYAGADPIIMCKLTRTCIGGAFIRVEGRHPFIWIAEKQAPGETAKGETKPAIGSGRHQIGYRYQCSCFRHTYTFSALASES